MQKQYFPIISLFSVTLAITGVQAGEQADAHCTPVGSAASGMVVHIDPDTGMPTSVPTPEQAKAMAALQAAAANRSSKGLVQEAGPTGGKMVNLRNRFRSPVVAVVQADGTTRIDHLNCIPAGEE